MPEVIEGLEKARSAGRLYPILTDRYCDFYAGHTTNGWQLLAWHCQSPPHPREGKVLHVSAGTACRSCTNAVRLSLPETIK